MKKLILGFLTLSNIAFGNLNGKWIGNGEWTYQGSGAYCYINMEFKDNSITLDRKMGYFDCGIIALNLTPAKFTKNGSDLLDSNGEIVGYYKDNIIKLREAYSDTVRIESEIVVNNLHFDYNESWIGSDNKEIYHLNGRLFTNR